MGESLLISDQIVVFHLDEQSFALPLSAVEKVIHAVEISYLPKAPEIIIGIINVKGQLIPVADIRKRLGLFSREMDPNNQLIIANTGKRQVAIMVDNVIGIRRLETGQLIATKDVCPFIENVRGVAKVEDGLIIIYNLEKFLSLDEEKELEQALNFKTHKP